MANCVLCGRPLPETSAERSHSCDECLREPAWQQPRPASVTFAPASGGPWITGLLIAANVAVFLLMLARGISPTHPSPGQLLKWGANWGALALGPQPWRMLTSAFLHAGFIHLALNMAGLWELGSLAERIFGKLSFLGLYLFSALGGAIVSLAWHPAVVSAGASGAVFGIAGALIAAFYFGHLVFPPAIRKRELAILLVVVIANLIYGELKPNIDNAAHLGGFAVGLLLATGLIHWPRSRSIRPLAFVGASLVLLLGAVSVRHFNGYIVHAEAGLQALQQNKLELAITQLNAALAERPRLPQAYFLLGTAYLRQQRYREAEANFRHAIGVNPKYAAAYANLGLVYLLTGRFQEAHTTLSKAEAFDPNDLQAQTYLGGALEGLERDDAALAVYQQVVARSLDAHVFYRIAALHLKSGRVDDAIAALEQAVRLRPDKPEYELLLATAYRRKGRNQEAEAALRKAAELAHPMPDPAKQ